MADHLGGNDLMTRAQQTGETIYVAEVFPIRWVKYKPGAPANLIRKGGRWQRMDEYGGWNNFSILEGSRIFETPKQLEVKQQTED